MKRKRYTDPFAHSDFIFDVKYIVACALIVAAVCAGYIFCPDNHKKEYENAAQSFSTGVMIGIMMPK